MSLSTTPIVGTRELAGKAVARYLVCSVSAGSAGVHAALVPDHYREAGLGLAAAFAAAAVALAAVAALIGSAAHDPWALAAGAAVLCGIAGGYLLSRTTGIPGLIADPEDPDPLGLLTTAAEFGAALLVVVRLRPLRKDQP